ncbi:hypothetical protein GCM10020001_010530 [Nonomuraea salmonea]
MRALDGELAAAEFGGKLVILEGEPGVGKTRLASEAARRALKRQFTVLAGRCTDPARKAYEPVAGAVERLARTSPALLLRAGIDQQCGQLVRLAPSLAAPPLSLEVPPATEPVSERYQLMAAARTLIERLATVRPVLLIIDDLQWATLESLQMLSALMWDSDALPLLVLAMSRPVPVESAPSQTLPELHKLTADARVIPVPAFGPGEVSDALAQSRARADAERLHRITGGNAFLVSEVIRELGAGKDLDALAVPDSVTRMVTARVAQLHPDARDLVSLLAVGERMDSAELRGGLDLDEPRFVAAVEEAMGTGLVTMLDNGSCRFSHELTRTALCTTLSAPRAALLHGRVADALLATDPPRDADQAVRGGRPPAGRRRAGPRPGTGERGGRRGRARRPARAGRARPPRGGHLVPAGARPAPRLPRRGPRTPRRAAGRVRQGDVAGRAPRRPPHPARRGRPGQGVRAPRPDRHRRARRRPGLLHLGGPPTASASRCSPRRARSSTPPTSAPARCWPRSSPPS